MNQETPLVKEIITVIRPTNRNRIFNEAEYNITTTTDAQGNRMVIMEPKAQIPTTDAEAHPGFYGTKETL